jgi:hypothetical protein
LLFNYSIVTIFVQVMSFIFFNIKAALLGAAALWIVLLLVTILQTEIKLKKSGL